MKSIIQHTDDIGSLKFRLPGSTKNRPPDGSRLFYRTSLVFTKDSYPDTPFLFPNEEGTDCIKKNAAYKVLNRICSNCGIKLDTTARKGTSAFRKTYSSKTYYAGGAEFESIVQGHSPDVAKKHYLDNDGLDMDEAVKILDAIGL